MTVSCFQILLESGAGINTHSNEFKESALTLACYKGHLEMVRFLLEAGADQVRTPSKQFEFEFEIRFRFLYFLCQIRKSVELNFNFESEFAVF